MYLTIHAAAGALIGTYVENSLISFIVGFMSHFFLDMLPHKDGELPTKTHSAKALRKLYFSKIVGLIYFDISMAIIVAGALFTNNIQFLTKPIIWGMIGAILPDVFQALSFFFAKNKILRKFNEFHNFIHYSPQQPISFINGHLTQLATLIILIRPLLI
ncbi:MAG: hypothetical protein RB292_03390 [Patescibacteria group bacterium]|jgi:hypothetical protein|nr:hypothetical protein [Patescibacteria group bacterium]